MTTHPLDLILYKPLDLDPVAICWLLHVYLREQNKKKSDERRHNNGVEGGELGALALVDVLDMVGLRSQSAPWG